MGEDQYALDRGYIPATRLNLQHFLWRETFDYNLHPGIPVTQDSVRIADVGTGTGIFLLDLAKRLPPTAHLDGFDISGSQFTPETFLPKNISMQVMDAMSEPPEHLLGKYDIVHLRLLLIVVNNNDPMPILRHCLKLLSECLSAEVTYSGQDLTVQKLEPGGYLQWDEADLYSQEVIPATDTASTENLRKWVPDLPDTFRKHGLEDVVVDARPEEWCFQKMFKEQEIILAEEFAGKFLDQKGPPGSGDAYRNLVRSAYAEVEQGSTITKRLQIVVGRKA
ncbi:MAG: hypothetical protein Q9187_003926 [Circinaria calcarea]